MHSLLICSKCGSKDTFDVTHRRRACGLEGKGGGGRGGLGWEQTSGRQHASEMINKKKKKKKKNFKNEVSITCELADRHKCVPYQAGSRVALHGA